MINTHHKMYHQALVKQFIIGSQIREEVCLFNKLLTTYSQGVVQLKIAGIDVGRYGVKVWYQNGFFNFLSNLGEYRDQEFDDERGKDDLIVEYNGVKMAGGTLAKRESEYGEILLTESKLHLDTEILVMIALHKAFKESCEVGIVTNLPVKYHSRDKAALKDMLQGYKSITVNGITKMFFINCEVSIEAASVYRYAKPGKTVRGLNIGSKTVNAITFTDRTKIGRESDTFDIGMETGKTKDPFSLARATAAKTGALKWKRDDEIYILGGGAQEVAKHLKQYYSSLILTDDPLFDDARAYYETAREIYGCR